eukprot:8928415-Prorocentrum_lima.AAC.1
MTPHKMQTILATVGPFPWGFPRWIVVGGMQRRTNTSPCTAPGLGPSVRGSNHVTKGKWLNFDGTRWH